MLLQFLILASKSRSTKTFDACAEFRCRNCFANSLVLESDIAQKFASAHFLPEIAAFAVYVGVILGDSQSHPICTAPKRNSPEDLVLRVGSSEPQWDVHSS